jgi:hypothetical protein
MVVFDFPRTLRDARPHTLSRIFDGDTPGHRPTRPHGLGRHPRESRVRRAAPTAQAKLDRCRQRLQDDTYQNLPEALRTYLVERLTQDAAERHINDCRWRTSRRDLICLEPTGTVRAEDGHLCPKQQVALVAMSKLGGPTVTELAGPA